MRAYLVLVLLPIVALAGVPWLLARWSAAVARTFALVPLPVTRRMLSPTVKDARAGARASYRDVAERAHIDVQRLPVRFLLRDGAVMTRYGDRATWLLERRSREGRYQILIRLLREGDEVTLDARLVLGMLPLPIVLAAVIHLFTNAVPGVVVFAFALTSVMMSAAIFARRATHIAAANEALDEIEDALADMDGASAVGTTVAISRPDPG